MLQDAILESFNSELKNRRVWIPGDGRKRFGRRSTLCLGGPNEKSSLHAYLQDLSLRSKWQGDATVSEL